MRILTIIAMALMTTSLAGCAVTQASLDPNSSRTVKRSFKDLTAARAIKARMLRAHEYKLKDISVDVSEGIAILAGSAPKESDKAEAVRIAWSAPAITEVGDEIRVGQAGGLFSKTKDEIISTSVRTKLAASTQVKNLNYAIETRDRIVYLMGVARDSHELAEAARLASITNGVREVISYATIKSNAGKTYIANAPMPSPPLTRAPELQMPQDNFPQNPDIDFWGTPVEPNQNGASNLPPIDQPMPFSPKHSVPDNGGIVSLDADAIESGEPFLRDPQTGERIILPPGVKPIPYAPNTLGGLGAGGAPLPPGAKPSRILSRAEMNVQNNAQTTPASVKFIEPPNTASFKRVEKPVPSPQSDMPVEVVWDGSKWIGVYK